MCECQIRSQPIHLIVGFANLEDDGCVDMLYVAAAMQSQGIATKLYNLLEVEARTRSLTRLYSDVSLTAREFFLGKGFSIENEYSKMVGDIVFPNTLMQKLLK
jgi:putative acetyltransferase